MNTKFIPSVFLFFIIILFPLLTSCASPDNSSKPRDFVGLSGAIPQQAELSFSKARLLWPSAKTSRGSDPNVCSDPEQAIRLLDEAISLAPDYAAAYLRRGMAKSDLRRYKEASADITKSIELAPTAEAYAFRGLVLIRDKKIEEARKNLEFSLQINDTYSQAWNFLGLLDVLEGKYRAACDKFDTACSNGDCLQYDNLRKNGFCD